MTIVSIAAIVSIATIVSIVTIETIASIATIVSIIILNFIVKGSKSFNFQLSICYVFLPIFRR